MNYRDYQSTKTTLEDWAMLVFMLTAAGSIVIGIVWLVARRWL